MQMNVSRTLLAALAAMAVLSAMAMPAASQDITSAVDTSNLAAMSLPQSVLMTISACNKADGSATFTVPFMAKVYKVDNMDYAAVATFKKPLQGTFDLSNSMGQISTADALPATAIMDHLKNSSVPVAGAQAVVALQDIDVTGATRGKFAFEFSKVSVYLPDGTAKAYKLDKPVEMSYSIDQYMMSIRADPAFISLMAGLLKTGTTFPSGAKPVKLDVVLAAK